jgi:MFS family permease
VTEEIIQEDRELIKMKSKRRMAWAAFWLLAVVGIGLIIVGVYSDNINRRIGDLSFLVGTLFTIWAGIIAAYYGVSAWITNTRSKK